MEWANTHYSLVETVAAAPQLKKAFDIKILKRVPSERPDVKFLFDHDVPDDLSYQGVDAPVQFTLGCGADTDVGGPVSYLSTTRLH